MSKAPIKAASAIALAFTLLLSGCSSSKNSAEGSLQIIPRLPSCSQSDIDTGGAWIKGQLAAFAQQDFKTAYSFASESFQSARSLDQFTQIITTQYGFLLNATSNSIDECTPVDKDFIFDVTVTSASGAQLPMKYALSKNADTWGIEAATVVPSKAKEEPVTPIV
jgi:hypothetical protein